MLRADNKPIAGETTSDNRVWHPIWAFDKDRKEGFVYLRSKHYSDIKKVPCKLVKFCHAAEGYTELY